MNICFLCGDLSRGGGTEKATNLIANKLAEDKNYSVTIVDVNNTKKSIFFEFDKSVIIHHLKIYNKFSLLRKNLELFRFLKNKRFDIIINVDIMLILYSFFPSKLTSTKIISWEQFNYYNDIGSNNTGKVRQFCLKHTDYYINLTKQDMITFKKNYRINIPIDYIYNPVESINRNVIYNIESKYLISVGNFYKSKGYDYCIKIGEKIFDKYPEWRWLFCGDGIEFENIKSMADESKYRDNFIFIGRTNCVDKYMKMSAIYISCSRSEGFGLVLTEAQKNKLPIVAFDVPFGPREIVINKKNGILVDAFDEDLMAKCIMNLISDKDLRKYYSLNSQNNFYKFNINTIIEKWKNIFTQIII